MNLRRDHWLALTGCGGGAAYFLYASTNASPGIAKWYLAFGGLGIAGFVLLLVIPWFGSEFEAAEDVELRADPERARALATSAMQDLSRGRSAVRNRRGVLELDLKPTRAGRVPSIGEHVTITIRPSASGTVAEVMSRYLYPMRKDSGINQENVAALVANLRELDSSNHPA